MKPVNSTVHPLPHCGVTHGYAVQGGMYSLDEVLTRGYSNKRVTGQYFRCYCPESFSKESKRCRIFSFV